MSGFILINNVELIQIDNHEETNKKAVKDLRHQIANILPNVNPREEEGNVSIWFSDRRFWVEERLPSVYLIHKDIPLRLSFGLFLVFLTLFGISNPGLSSISYRYHR